MGLQFESGVSIMGTKILEIAPSLGKWALLHNHVALATFDTEDAAERAAQAIARTQPAGDDGEIRVIEEDNDEAV
jgi:hydrogenase maturation factor